MSFGVVSYSQLPFNTVGGADDNAAQWHQPLSEPVRTRSRRTAIAASGMAAGAYAQPAADNANVRWRVPFALPVRYVRDRRYAATFVSGEPSWPYDQPASDNANVRWQRPLSEPKRFLRDPRFASALDASGELKWPHNQPAADNANVRWYAPFGEPNWRVRNPRFWAALTVDQFDIGYHQPAADNANARWFAALSEPVRYKRDPRFSATFDASGSPPWAYDQPASDNGNVRWHSPFAEPVRFKRDPRYPAAFSGEFPWPYNQPAVDNAHVRWLSPWSSPQARRRSPPVDGVYVRFPDVVVTIYADSWYVSWEIPVRRRARPNGSVTDVINTTSPSVDGWYRSFPEVNRRQGSIGSRSGSFDAPPFVFVGVEWLQAWDLPARARARPSESISFNPLPLPAWDWQQAWSQPARIKRRVPDAWSFAAPDTFISPASWLGVVWSAPARAIPRRLADYFFWSTQFDFAAPAITPDMWFVRWSQPNRAPPKPTWEQYSFAPPIIFAPHLVPRLGLVNRRHRIVGMVNAEGKLVGLAGDERIAGVSNSDDKTIGLANLRRKITGVTFH